MSVYEENLYYAQLGDPLAQSSIIHGCGSAAQHNWYDEEQGYPKDISISHYWADKLKENAASGNTLAQYEISKARLDLPDIVARLVTNDTREILIDLQKKYVDIINEKIDKNDPYAMFAVGNDKNDLNMLEKAANLGCSLACESLQFYYCLGGFGSDIDFSKSQPEMQFYYSQKGANSNDFYACRCQYHLADCYREGIGVEKDANKYLCWLNKAAENGCYKAIERKKQLSVYANNSGGSSSSQSCAGCYVATCIYGSYDCPEVWTLRRYRDFCLVKKWCGRVFIKIYYTISPILVKWFGDTKWFVKFWKKILDKIVSELQKQGYENTKYFDR